MKEAKKIWEELKGIERDVDNSIMEYVKRYSGTNGLDLIEFIDTRNGIVEGVMLEGDTLFFCVYLHSNDVHAGGFDDDMFLMKSSDFYIEERLGVLESLEKMFA